MEREATAVGIAVYSCRAKLLCLIVLTLFSVSLCPGPVLSVESSSSTDKFLDQPLEDNYFETAQASALSMDDMENYSSSAGSEQSITWFLVKTFLVLVLLSGVIWGLSKLLSKTGITGQNNDLMSIRSTLPLGQNQYLQVVQVGKKFFMLGVTNENVSMLGELNDSETIKGIQLRSERNSGNQDASGFSGLLKRFVGSDQHDFQNSNDQNQFDHLREKIQNLKNQGGGTT